MSKILHQTNKERKSQEQIILEWLKNGNTITAKDAVNLCNCYRLSAVIFNLRQKGYDIITHHEPNQYKGIHSRYELLSK